MTETETGAYDVVIDGADFLAGTARIATSEDKSDGFVVQIDPDTETIIPTKLYPVHVRVSAIKTKADAMELALRFFKICVGDHIRAVKGRNPELEELVHLERNLAGSKIVAMKAWEA